eukprot:CAMPEP_0183453826 /NCGR_PEP_ID=MMETSP0370-20130417/122149_1 /TAXON_ID=268820 /ORGANISM="Peridinium aciculiferum, Strain PAER-2" /LENGTH=113 /DNA_ID=CAMNT_0025645259 /DNA_START=37 /DNA_END=378 /DNA_ORIENTATION=+
MSHSGILKLGPWGSAGTLEQHSSCKHSVLPQLKVSKERKDQPSPQTVTEHTPARPQHSSPAQRSPLQRLGSSRFFTQLALQSIAEQEPYTTSQHSHLKHLIPSQTSGGDSLGT